MNEQRPERESVWSVGQTWLPWCLALIFLLTIGWTSFVARTEATQGKSENVSQPAIIVANQSALAIPLIVLFATIVVTVVDTVGGAIVVTKRYLDNKFVEPIRKQLRKDGREEERRLWMDWNRRRGEAEQKGEPFNEPPPFSESPNGKDA